MPPVADHAYAHCLAVLGDHHQAAEASALAVRRGGRARWAVLAHARHEALSRQAVELDGSKASADLADFAQRLAFTRPAEERALLDLADRHGLDRAGLGRVWGAPPEDVATQVAAASATWTRELDPVVLAWMGPGDCGDLAELLAETADPLQAGPTVAGHAETCETCADRMRAMVSVRTLLGTRPLAPAPAGVAASSRRRRRRPVPVPATAGRFRQRRLWVWGVVAVAAIAIGAATVDVATTRPDERDRRIEALTTLAEGESALVLAPNELRGDPPPPVVLRNRSARQVTWTAAAKEWVRLQPDRGTLAPGDAVTVQVRLRDAAPEGAINTTVTFSGGDGSSAALQFTALVERPPDIDASADECAVTAAIEDEADIAAVRLHWRTEAEDASALMLERAEAWTASLPSQDAPATWWVTATDARGNAAATAPVRLPPFCGRT